MEVSSEDILRIQKSIKNVSSYDFCDYSEKSFARRIEKILTDRDISVDTLIKNLERDYNFLEDIVQGITVNTTELFRNPESWINIKKLILSRYSNQKNINIWHCGCSNGLEVYSLLMLLSELGLFDKVSIYGSDINCRILKKASLGRYKYRDVVEHINNFDLVFNSPENGDGTIPISKYMDINKFRDYVQIKKSLVEKPVFIKHDLVSLENIIDAKFHIIFCRNVLIYFNNDLQQRVVKFFRDNLFDGGSLIIGKHEGIIGYSATLFDKYENIFIKK